MSTSKFSIVSEENAQCYPYSYVYEEDDKGVRELRSPERAILEEACHPCDGDRLYIKHSWDQLDGWGKRSGLVARSSVPDDVEIVPVSEDAGV